MSTDPYVSGHSAGPLQRLPISLMTDTLCALLNISLKPCVVGSLSLLELLPRHLWDCLTTEDVDYLLALDSAEQVAQVEDAMRALGFVRPPGRSGKWLFPGETKAAVDLIGKTAPSGFAEPACFPEPFANVIYLDRAKCSVIPRLIEHKRSAHIEVAGPLVTALGKTLKITRYLTLADWGENDYRRSRAARAARDTIQVIVHNPDSFEASAGSELAGKARDAGEGVYRAFARGIRSLSSLYGTRERTGWSLAGMSNPDINGLASKVVPLIEQVALGSLRGET